MESLKAIKNRIQSIRSTRQITQSMRLVSTSKVQKVRARMEANRLFLRESEQLMHMVAGAVSGTDNRYWKAPANARAAVIVIDGDRGLCGGYNINVNKEALRLIREREAVRLVVVGAKGREFFARRGMEPTAAYSGISENPFFEDAAEVMGTVLDWFHRGVVDEVYVVHTAFESMLKHTPRAARLLPLPPARAQEAGPQALVRCEPAGEGMLERTVGFYLTAYLFGAILEASCCEQSARIASMDSAVKNADEMIETLTLRYNQARQGAITQEITEIVGGANAV